MATKTIPKNPDLKPQPSPQKERQVGTCLRPEEWEKTVPISREEFTRLQEAWFAIGDLASLLKEVRCEEVTNPDTILRILTGELGEVVTKLEAKFEVAKGGSD